MLISDHAILPENKSGFWVQKQYSETGHCTYLVFHQRMTEFCDSISEAKQKLRDRYIQYLALRKVSDALYSKAMNQIAERQWGLMTGRDIGRGERITATDIQNRDKHKI